MRFPRDFDMLAAMVSKTYTRLVVSDPIVAFLETGIAKLCLPAPLVPGK